MKNFSIACNAQEMAGTIAKIEILQSQVHHGMSIGESIFESVVNEPMQEVIDKNKMKWENATEEEKEWEKIKLDEYNNSLK